MSEASGRTVKGGRAAFFENPETDRLLAMLMRLVTEHWALRERVLSLEKLLVENDILTNEAIESFVPDADTDAAWYAESVALMQAIVESGRNIDSPNK